MSAKPNTARLFQRMADHLVAQGRADLPIEEDGLEEAARAATASGMTAMLAVVNAPEITPGETREAYANRLRDEAGGNS